MKNLILTAIALVVPVFFATVFVLDRYHRLARLRHGLTKAFAPVKASLLERCALVRRLIEIAQDQGQTNAAALEAVGAANSAVSQSALAMSGPDHRSAWKQLTDAQTAFAAHREHLQTLVPASPDRAGGPWTQDLLKELAATEMALGLAAHAYNQAVTDYNAARQVFPARFLAKICHFVPAEPFAPTARVQSGRHAAVL